MKSPLYYIIWVYNPVFIAAMLLYKALVANDIHATVAQDPMENWLAIGIAFLLMRGAAKEWRAM